MYSYKHLLVPNSNANYLAKFAKYLFIETREKKFLNKIFEQQKFVHDS